jgi:hypothetical protein
MTPELEDALFTDFPDVFPGGRNVDMRSSLICFGCECGDGWAGLIRNLCVQIQGALDADPELKPTFAALQVKEKFGGLRFYINGGNDAIENMITQAERLSETTCEVCGKPGRMREKNRWMRTLCDSCAKEGGYQ